MLHSVDLNDYMLRHPPTLSPDADIYEAIALITDHMLSGLCVVDAKGELLGVLSELDCLDATFPAMYDGGRHVGKVRDHMTPLEKVVIAAPGDDIVDIANDMLRNRLRHRPVVEDGKLVGQITCHQLLRAIRKFSGVIFPPRGSQD